MCSFALIPQQGGAKFQFNSQPVSKRAFVCRVTARRTAGSDVDSDADEAAVVVRRPKKGPAYQYSAHEDTAILRAFARSLSEPQRLICAYFMA